MTSSVTGARRPDALQVRKLTVYPDRLHVVVWVDPAHRHTSPALAQACVERFPELPLHTCKNAKGTTFVSVMEDTSVPHLLEHLVISLQARQPGAADFDFVGTTQWGAEENVAHVQVNFRNDVQALAAVKEAASILNRLLADFA